MLGIFLAGIAPGLAFLTYFFLKSKTELKSLSIVIQMYIFGAITMIPAAFIEYLLNIGNVFRSEMVSAFFSTGLLEEMFKWFILFIAILYKVEFNKPYDGIVYGTSVSLGFATSENVLYLIANGWEFALNRALLPVSSHALFGVIMGYYVGIAKLIHEFKSVWMVLSILVPSILHGIYNYILLSQNSWLPAMIPFMLFLWWISIKKVQMAEILGENYLNKQKNINMV